MDPLLSIGYYSSENHQPRYLSTFLCKKKPSEVVQIVKGMCENGDTVCILEKKLSEFSIRYYGDSFCSLTIKLYLNDEGLFICYVDPQGDARYYANFFRTLTGRISNAESDVDVTPWVPVMPKYLPLPPDFEQKYTISDEDKKKYLEEHIRIILCFLNDSSVKNWLNATESILEMKDEERQEFLVSHYCDFLESTKKFYSVFTDKYSFYALKIIYMICVYLRDIENVNIPLILEVRNLIIEKRKTECTPESLMEKITFIDDYLLSKESKN